MFVSPVNCYSRLRAGNSKEFRDITDYVCYLRPVARGPPCDLWPVTYGLDPPQASIEKQ